MVPIEGNPSKEDVQHCLSKKSMKFFKDQISALFLPIGGDILNL